MVVQVPALAGGMRFPYLSTTACLLRMVAVLGLLQGLWLSVWIPPWTLLAVLQR